MLLLLIDSLKLIFATVTTSTSISIHNLRFQLKISKSEKIDGIIGGTHLVGRSEDYLNRTIQELKKFNLGLISPCHCTGFKATARRNGVTRAWRLV